MKKLLTILLTIIALQANAQFKFNNGKATANMDTLGTRNDTLFLRNRVTGEVSFFVPENGETITTREKVATQINDSNQLIKENIHALTDSIDSLRIDIGSGGLMVYPGAGIPLSTGGAWDASLPVSRVDSTYNTLKVGTGNDSLVVNPNGTEQFYYNANLLRYTDVGGGTHTGTATNYTNTSLNGVGVFNDEGSQTFLSAQTFSLTHPDKYILMGSSGLNIRKTEDVFTAWNFTSDSIIYLGKKSPGGFDRYAVEVTAQSIKQVVGGINTFETDTTGNITTTGNIDITGEYRINGVPIGTGGVDSTLMQSKYEALLQDSIFVYSLTGSSTAINLSRYIGVEYNLYDMATGAMTITVADGYKTFGCASGIIRADGVTTPNVTAFTVFYGTYTNTNDVDNHWFAIRRNGVNYWYWSQSEN